LIVKDKKKLVLNKNKPGEFSTFTFNLKVDKAKIRHDTMNGRDHLVVPAVMITEGVHNGSLGPLFYSEEECSKRPGLWNNKPVVVYHPEANGVGVSACDPDIINTYGIGVLMNTHWEKEGLKTECWIEEEKTKEVDDRVLNALDEGLMMEVSTGLFTEIERVEGEWKGEKYVGIASNFQPDHLAILPDLKGACSIEDGAGFLRNEKIARTEATPEALQALGESIIILVRGKGQGTGGAKQGDGGTDTCVCPECGATAPHKRGTPCVNVSCPKCSAKMVGSGAVKNAMRAFQEIIKNELSHSEIWRMLNDKINSASMDTWVDEVFDDFFIYHKGEKSYYQEYEIKDDEARLIGLRKEAEKQIQYVLTDGTVVGNEDMSVLNTNVHRKDINMNKKDIVEGLISNENSHWTEEDREGLMAFSKTKLMAIVDNQKKEEEAKEEEKPEKKETKVTEPKDDATVVKEDLQEKPAENKEETVEEYIAKAPASIQDMLRSGVQAHLAEKASLINQITANSRNPFTPEQLQAKGLDELKAIAQLAEVPATKPEVPLPKPTFAGMAPVAPVENADEEEEALEMPAVLNVVEE